jgi:hypothetical protein
MRASRFYASKDLRVQEIEATEVCRPKQVIVKVAWCGICGTDLHEYVMGPILMPRQQSSVGAFPDRAGDSRIIRLIGARMKYQSINFQQKFALFTEQWAPKVIAEMNDYQFKIVKLKGDFIWHFAIDTYYPTPNEIRLAEQRVQRYWHSNAQRFSNSTRYLAVYTTSVLQTEIIQDLYAKVISSLFSVNLGRNWAMFSSQSVYVLEPLHLTLEITNSARYTLSLKRRLCL